MAAATYATREELNLPVLIFEADDVSGANPVAELDTDEKKIRQMLLGKIERLDSVADKLLAQKKKVILRDVDGDRAKVCVGTKDGDDVLLVLRKSGGTIGKPQTYIPELHCGKMLNILDPGIIFFTEQLSLEFFLRNKRYKKLGIKNQGQLYKAWKRWLVRVWAHMLPTSKVVHHSGRSQEDMAKAKPSGRKRGRSGAPRTNGQADNHPAALTEAEQANKELDDKYGVTRSEEWWSKFNKRSKDFDLDDEEVVRSIRAGWIKAKYPLDQGRMESPSLEVLEEAKAGAQINKVTIENTVDYQNWLWGQSMGARGKVNQTFYPSLFERRAKAKQAEQTKGERGRSGTRRNKPNAGVESEADGSTMGAPPKKKRAFTKEQLDFLKRSKASSD